MDTSEQTLVIARHKENLDWVKSKHIVIQKDKDLPNIGHEPTSFLFFIVKNYCQLEGEYIFVQGNPFDHHNPLDGKDRERFTCEPDGAPHDSGLLIHEVCKELDLPILDEYQFHPGGQFKVTAEQIKQREWVWYVKALALCNEGKNPWVFERIWDYIWCDKIVL
jgi:hypothetical protein